jgi:hypothetical protein
VSGRCLSNRVIVVGVGEPGAAARQARETTVELRPKSIQITASKLVNGDEDDERRRRRGAGISLGEGLGTGAGAARDAKD